MFKFDLFNWKDVEPPANKVESAARHAWEIVPWEGEKYAVTYRGSRVLVGCEYDNAFYYGWTAVVLSKEGRWGAICMLDDKGDRIMKVACLFDTVEALNWDLLFTRRGESLFYHDGTRKAWRFLEVSAHGPDACFLFGETDREYLLLDRYSGEVIWKDSKNSPRYRFGSPCLAYMGVHDGLPLFFDATYGICLIPQDGELVWREDMSDLISPIAVNGKNILNVIEERGLLKAVSLLDQDQAKGHAETQDANDRAVFDVSLMVVARNDHAHDVCGFHVDSFVAGEYPDIGWGL